MKTKTKVFILSLILILLGSYQLYEQGFIGNAYLRAHFLNPDGSKSQIFKLKVAKTKEQVAKGLMFVKQMSAHEGMIFIFDHMKIRNFWMKNTYLSLDMVFLDQNKKVVNIIPNVPILNTEKRNSAVPAQYVVELLAGESAKNNITKGSVLYF